MSATMVDAYNNYGLPPRKPLPPGTTRPVVPSSQSAAPQPAHRHTRTSSSNIFPPMSTSPVAPAVISTTQYPTQAGYSTMTTTAAHQQQSLPMRTQRTLSNATSSTTSSQSSSGHLRRTGSNHTTSSVTATSYVALLRKQKATVWCSHAQQLPANFLAQQKLAKQRANLEVVGSQSPIRTPLSSAPKQGMTSKIRHGGAKKTGKFTGVSAAGGVPMRLSATEVDDGDSEDDNHYGQFGMHHHRTGSGRSSIGGNSGRPAYAPLAITTQQGHISQGSTPPSASSPQSPHSMAEEETPVPGHYQSSQQPPDYFAQTRTGLSNNSGSGSSGSRENSFGDVGKMPEKLPPSEARDKTADDLRRRGSVDDRTTTMRGVGRLFVANPDLSD